MGSLKSLHNQQGWASPPCYLSLSVFWPHSISLSFKAKHLKRKSLTLELLCISQSIVVLGHSLYQVQPWHYYSVIFSLIFQCDFFVGRALRRQALHFLKCILILTSQTQCSSGCLLPLGLYLMLFISLTEFTSVLTEVSFLTFFHISAT